VRVVELQHALPPATLAANSEDGARPTDEEIRQIIADDLLAKHA